MVGSKEYLREFGLNSKQISIYLSLLKSGPATIMNLSNRLKINRTSVHITVEELITKGILEEVMEKTKRKVRALPPERFNNIIDEQLRAIEKKQTLIPNLIESIYKDTSYIQDSSQTQVKHYNTVESINWLYDQILLSKEVRSYFNTHEVRKVFPDNVKKFIKAVQRGVRVWDIHHYSNLVEAPFDTLGETYPNYGFKRLPRSVKFDSMDFLMYDGKIAIIFGFPHPLAIEIENKFYYEMSKELFDFVWSVLP